MVTADTTRGHPKEPVAVGVPATRHPKALLTAPGDQLDRTRAAREEGVESSGQRLVGEGARLGQAGLDDRGGTGVVDIQRDQILGGKVASTVEFCYTEQHMSL